MSDEGATAHADASSEIAARIDGYLSQITEYRDVDAAGDFYTPDARLIMPGAEMDRAGVIEVIRGVFDAGINVRVQRRTVELFVHGDTAYEIAQAEDSLDNPDGTSNTIRNNLFIRWEKGADGNWRFARVLLSPQDAATE